MEKSTGFIVSSSSFDLRTRLLEFASKHSLVGSEYGEYSVSGQDFEKALIIFDARESSQSKILKYFFRESSRIPNLFFAVFLDEKHLEPFSHIFDYENIGIFPVNYTGFLFFEKRASAFIHRKNKIDANVKNIRLFDKALKQIDSFAIVLNEQAVITNIFGGVNSLLIDEREQMIGASIREFVPIENAGLMAELVKNCIVHGERKSACIKIAGEFRDLILFPNDTGAVLVAKNADERIKVAGELQDTQHLLQTVIHNSPVGLWIIDSTGVIKFAEGAMYMELGFIPSELIGSNIKDLDPVYKDFTGKIELALSNKIDRFETKFADKYYETYASSYESNNMRGIICISIESTKRKIAELELQKNKERLELALHSTSIGLWDMELETGFTYFSPEINLIFDFDVTDNFTWPDLVKHVHIDDIEVYENFIRDIIANIRYNSDFELRIITKNGQEKWIRCLAKCAEVDDEGKGARLIGIMEDIGSRKRYENLLAESETRLKSIINTSRSLIILFDADKKVIEFNKKAFESLLVDFGVYLTIGKSYSEIPFISFQPRFSQNFDTVLLGSTVRKEIDYTEIYGYNVWYDMNLAPVTDLRGDVKSVCLFLSPISDRKLFELELRENKATLQAILDASPVGIGLNVDAKFVWANSAFFKIFKFNGNISGVDTKEFFPSDEEFYEFRSTFLPELLDTGSVIVERKMKRYDGEIIDCLVMARLKSPNKSNGDFVVVVMDVTEIKKEAAQKESILREKIEAEKKRNEAMQLVEHSARIASIGLITGGITHEINQPLNAIRVAADGILFWNDKHDLVIPDPISKLIEKISGAATKIDDIIQHMRSFWINAGKNEHYELDLNESIARALNLVSQRLHSKNIKIIKRFADEKLIIKANPLLIELMVNNLTINAMQALEEKDIPEKNITVYTGLIDERAFLKIVDNGPGLPDVDSELLFDPLFSTKKNKEGTGLGLSIIRMFLSKIDGEISAKNGVSEGAEFLILFAKN